MNTTKESLHGSYRKTAIIVGVLFIIGTVAGVLGMVVGGRFLNAPDLLNMVSANASQVGLQALLVLVMGVPLAMVPASVAQSTGSNPCSPGHRLQPRRPDVLLPVVSSETHSAMAIRLGAYWGHTVWGRGLIYVFTGTTLVIVLMPLALQEMVMAIWLIVKGFNPSAIDSGAARTATNELLSAA